MASNGKKRIEEIEVASNGKKENKTAASGWMRQFKVLKLNILFLFSLPQDQVHDDAEDEGYSNLCQGHFTDLDDHTADTADQDDRCGKEVTVVIQVDRLKHLKTGHCNKTVQSDADTTHDTSGNRGKECYERSYERGNDRGECEAGS